MTEVLVAKWIQAGTDGALQLQTETERSRWLQARTKVARRLQAEKDGAGRPTLGCRAWKEGGSLAADVRLLMLS